MNKIETLANIDNIALIERYYNFSKIVYVLLSIAIITTIISLICNVYFYSRYKNVFNDLKGFKTIKIISFISSLLLPLSIIGVISCLTLL